MSANVSASVCVSVCKLFVCGVWSVVSVRTRCESLVLLLGREGGEEEQKRERKREEGSSGVCCWDGALAAGGDPPAIESI